MIFRFRMFFPMVLIIIGIIWCAEIAKRWRDDWTTFRNGKEPFDKSIVVGYWFVTAIIGYFLATSGLDYILRLVHSVIDLARW